MSEFEYNILRQIIDKNKQDRTRDNNKCLTCENDDLIIDNTTNEHICKKCGCVNECNNYDLLTSFDEMQTTTISDTSSINITIKGLTNWKLKNYYKWHFVMPYKERSLNEIFKFIQRKCKELQLTKYVSDDANILYKIVRQNYTNKDLNKVKQNEIKDIITRGNNKLGIIGACIFYACKKTGYLRTIRNISQILKIKSSFINNGCKIFSKCLKCSNIDININLSFPSQYLKNIAITLNLESTHIINLDKILKKIENYNLISNHTPFSIAVSTVIVYLEKNNVTVSKKEISEKLLISLVTINKTIKTILKIENILFNDADVTNNLTTLTADDKKYLIEQKQYFEQIDIHHHDNLQINLTKIFF